MTTPAGKKVWPTFVWGAVIFCAFWLLAFLAMWLATDFESYEEQRAKMRFERLEKNREAQLAKISSYGWVNQEQGLVHIPIEGAMQTTMRDLQQKEVGPSSVAVATPAATGQTQDAAQPEASPAETPAASPAPDAMGGEVQPEPTPSVEATPGPAAAPEETPAAKRARKAQSPQPAATPQTE